jgi:enamine deaminase RidA (YjgF/YER057c/UK114 family)
MSISENIVQLGLDIPVLAKSNALFQPYALEGTILTISGQLPILNGKVSAIGSVPNEVPLEAAREAAKLCVLNILASVRDATAGDWERVSSLVRLGGFVVTSHGFFDAPAIINAASELMLSVFGEKGRHARVAIGVASLPLGAAVEVEATFALKA